MESRCVFCSTVCAAAEVPLCADCSAQNAVAANSLSEHWVPPDSAHFGARSGEVEYTVFVGNPGTGKSTLLNGVIGALRFKSGISYGGGLTQRLQMVQLSPTVWVGDTPGLDDINARKMAAKQIEEAMKRDGRYRLVFVVTLEAGRCRSADAWTVREVLKAIKADVPFGVIFNKLDPLEVNDLENNDQFLQAVATGILSGTDRTTHHFLLLPRVDKLMGKNDAIPPAEIVADVAEFLRGVPFVQVAPAQVDKINALTFEEMQDQLTKEIAKLQTDQAHREAVWAQRLHDTEAAHAQQMKEFVERRDEQMRELERQRVEMEARFQQQIQAARADADRVAQLHEQQKATVQQLQQQITELQRRPPPAPVIHRAPRRRGGCVIC